AQLARLGPRADLDQLVPVDDLGADEPLLEVRVDDAGAAGRLPAGAEGPGPRLLLARGEERAQAEEVVGGAHEAGQRTLAQAERLEHLGPILERQLVGLGLELDAHA